MQGKYRLVGIMNMFGIVPDFVYPIFEKDNQYYFIIGDEETLKIEGFEEVKESAVKKIVFLNNLKTNEFQPREFSEESEPIFVFQSSEGEVFIGFFESIKEFLQTFETEDEILKESIWDFISNTGIKK